MFTPVAPEIFYETPAGQQFLERFATPDHDAIGLHARYQEVEWRDRDGETYTEREFLPTTPEQRDEIKKDYARYLNANYDPETGMCELYRVVDDERRDDFLEHGVVSSRTVEIFGQHDMARAIDALESTAAGDMPDYVRQELERRIALSQARLDAKDSEVLRHFADFYQEQHDRVVELARGEPSAKLVETMRAKAILLKSASELGKTAYRAAVKETANDDIPMPDDLVMPSEILHTSIHLTSSKEFVSKYLAPERNNILRVRFRPGTLPVGPFYGYVDGGFIFPEESQADDEWEWYGVGQLATGLDVSIDLIPVSELAD